MPEASRARHLRGSFPRSRGWNASVSGLLSGSGRDLTRRAAQCAPGRPEENPLGKKSERDLAPADESASRLFSRRVANPECVTNDRCAGAKLQGRAPVGISKMPKCISSHTVLPVRRIAHPSPIGPHRRPVKFLVSEGSGRFCPALGCGARRWRRKAPVRFRVWEADGEAPRRGAGDLSRRCRRSPLDARPPRRRRRHDRALSGAPRIPVIEEGCRASAAAPRGFAALVTAPAPRGSSSGPRTGPASARRRPAAGATIP